VLSSLYRYLPQKAVGALCALILCGTLVAGLWPFHSPKNQVHWLEDGLRFGRYGTVLSAGQFEPAGSDRSSCSLEIWVKPARTWGTGTFLAFFDPLSRREFSLQQDYIDLGLQRSVGDEAQTNLRVEEVFRRKQLLITVTADGQNTAIYIDGDFVIRSSQFRLSIHDFSGRLILATAPLQSNSWSGEVQGLAIYSSELTADQVARHYAQWTQKGRPNVSDNDRALALYLFNENTGKIIHNQVRSGIDLYIPDRYQVVHQTLLENPWTEFQTQKTYLNNALINIAGFVPLGLCFCAYFVSVRQIKHGILATIALGAIVSLTIELLQAYLPTRDSGVTDLITNTVGTGVGVALYCAVASLARTSAAKRWPWYLGISPSQGRQQNEGDKIGRC
jgi:VanZ family protein